MNLTDERSLRDFLSENLYLLGNDLTLVQKEAFLPNEIGTRSFVDILAVDSNNRYVLIELKKNSSASREAIHEIYKYVEAIKAHLGVRNEEVRVLLVSMDWTELLVPFSRFVHETTISVKGIHIKCNTKSGVDVVAIEPLKIQQGRYIAPWHEVNFYHDEKSLTRGIEDYIRIFKDRCVEDYVLVILKASPLFNEISRNSFVENIVQFGKSVDEARDLYDRGVGEIQYMIYFGMKLFNVEEGLSKLNSKELRLEVEEYIDDDESEYDKLSCIHEYFYAMNPRPHCDSYEIGYAAKLKSRFLQDEQWSVQKIIRHGIFRRNIALSDDAIIDELCGADGATSQGLDFEVNISDSSQFDALKTYVKRCLQYNTRWFFQVNRLIDEIKSDYPNSKVKVHVYNPCAGLMSIFFVKTRGILFLPSFSIEVDLPDIKHAYIGFLDYSYKKWSLNSILKIFYNNDLFELLITLNWGGYEQRDTEILEELGLSYRTGRILDVHGERSVSVLRDDIWYQHSDSDFFKGIAHFYSDNATAVEELEQEVGSRYNGWMVNASRKDM